MRRGGFDDLCFLVATAAVLTNQLCDGVVAGVFRRLSRRQSPRAAHGLYPNAGDL